ncbi:5'-3' DNA helicase [Fusarium tjaetaba]|uniref:ATP-dependent DNA helicase n=1 Tax=Fusarium tjaetaba TaxID=1567544 RepID=A0A8H5VJG9_9HYPO|nr:5'-3' DNA helicase [Fusarium tjaetaba]KAF5623269.1 5'-3' DNA helicase [Fusarium tjaetaba]
MMSMTESDSGSNGRTSRLFETAELIGFRFLELAGNYSTSELSEPSLTWQDWIFAESRRRMSCLWLIIGCVITIENGKKCSICSDMRSLPLPSSKLLWEARSLEEWQTEKAFYDMSCPFVTLGELVEAKANAGDPVEAQRLQNWEMGSDKTAAMLNIAVEFEGTKRKASDAALISNNDNQSQSLPPSPKRTQRETSFLSISSGGRKDVHQNDGMAPSNDQPVDPGPTLSAEQQVVLDTILRGGNVFITGSAGCGKSYLLRAAIDKLKAMGKQVAVCAPTGRAAVHVGGMTTFSYMSWAPDMFKKGIDHLKGIAKRKGKTRQRHGKTDVLIIDEISMVSSDFLNRMNIWMKYARWGQEQGARPFGGLQLIVTGDFCQLPPVNAFEYCYTCGGELRPNKVTGIYRCPNSRDHGPWVDEDKWAFRSAAWAEANFASFNLREIHRQNDLTFIRMLEKCRLGVPFTENDIHLLMHHDCEVDNAPQLLCTRNEIIPINDEKRKAITNYPEREYSVLDGFDCKNYRHKDEFSRYFEQLENSTLKVHEDHPFEAVVKLKETMQVMLQVNLDIRAGLANGSQGVICGWEKIDINVLPKLGGEHSSVREAYVKKFTEQHQQNDPDAKDQFWPVVRFNNGQIRTIYPWCMLTTVGMKEPYSFLHRTQIPLIPGWAITVHKSQGMSLERVIVNLTEAFAEGQVYVALSRATSLRGLKVEGGALGLTVGEGGNHEVRQFLADTFGTEMFKQLEDEEHEES